MPAKKIAKKVARAGREIDVMMAKVNKEHGDNAVTKARKLPVANHIPTGCFMLDFALLGGIAEGYATMLYGYESSGKTFKALKAVAGFQRKHPKKEAVWVDFEGMFDKDWAETLGCDLDRLNVVRPTMGNEGVDMIEALMEPVEVGMIVVDSIPGCVPKRVLDNSAEDKTMGELAALMGVMCSKILCAWATERRRSHWVTVILINQWRSKLGVMFGDPRTLPGGRQINHLPTTKIELKNKEVEGKDSFDSHMMVRNEHSFKITKAKHGRSVREGEFHVSLDEDANDGVGVFDYINHKAVVVYAKRMGVLTGGGSNGYRFTGIRGSFRTFEAAGQHLLDHPEDMIRMQRMLISMQRVDKGQPELPPDGYLVGPVVDEDAPSGKRRIRRIECL